MSGFFFTSRPNNFLVLISLGIGLCLFGCKDDASTDSSPTLEGRWEIERALRNGRPAESLADLYFQFGPAEQFSTNISGVAETGTYAENEGEITSDGISMPLTYTVVSLLDTALNLKANVANYRFEFFLRRAADQKENSMPGK